MPKWKVTWVMEDSVVVPALNAELAGKATMEAMTQHGVKIRLLSVEPVEEVKHEQA